MRKSVAFAVLAGLAMTTVGIRGEAAVKVPPVFSDHMVLQRDMADPVWGTASPGEKVTIKFRDQTKTTDADTKGKWSIKLDSLKAGGPDPLTINEVTISDVLVGDVWVGSGQSNMQLAANYFIPHDPALQKNVAAGAYPQIRIIKPNTTWLTSSPANLTGFSALLFSFGLPLQKEINVPIGLMVGAVGGTPSGAWLSPEALHSDEAVQAQAQKAMATYKPEDDQKLYEKQLAAWPQAVEAARAAKTRIPKKPELLGKPGELNGGKEPGYLFKVHIEPYIPYAIKGVLWDQGEAGTAVRGVDQYTVMGALIHGWRKEWGQGDFPFIYVQKPSGGGCAWDPNDPMTVNADKFSSTLPPIAPGPGAGISREIHIHISQYPNTFLVIGSDLGGMTHPTNKTAYGTRASRVALGAVYGRKIEIYGPVFETAKVGGDEIRVGFTHVGQGLAAAQSDKLQGFEIAGEDRKFYWADAKIDGDGVIVRSDRVAKPVAVRYAWGATFPWANLFNKDGLPAQTFRTDTW